MCGAARVDFILLVFGRADTVLGVMLLLVLVVIMVVVVVMVCLQIHCSFGLVATRGGQWDVGLGSGRSRDFGDVFTFVAAFETDAARYLRSRPVEPNPPSVCCRSRRMPKQGYRRTRPLIDEEGKGGGGKTLPNG